MQRRRRKIGRGVAVGVGCGGKCLCGGHASIGGTEDACLVLWTAFPGCHGESEFVGTFLQGQWIGFLTAILTVVHAPVEGFALISVEANEGAVARAVVVGILMYYIVLLHRPPAFGEVAIQHVAVVDGIDGRHVREDGLDGHVVIGHGELSFVADAHTAVDDVPSAQGIAFVGSNRERHHLAFNGGVGIGHHGSVLHLAYADAKPLFLQSCRGVDHLVDIHVQAAGVLDHQVVHAFVEGSVERGLAPLVGGGLLTTCLLPRTIDIDGEIA